MENAITFLSMKFAEIDFREAGGIERAANRNSNRLVSDEDGGGNTHRMLFAQIIEKAWNHARWDSAPKERSHQYLY